MLLFNSFLARLESIPTLRAVIITAGNHDSARRLHSLKPVLQRLGIHIVGAFHNMNEAWDEWLIPIKNAEGVVQATVAAVPFVHEYRLGIGKSTREDYANEIKDAFFKLYTHFAELSKSMYPSVPRIAMGHLTAMNEEKVVGEAPQNVHIAVENGMDGAIFGTDYSYVALGHIHKNYRVRGNANAYYCGSPLPCSIAEAEDSMKRGAWFVDLHQSPTPQFLEMPVIRQFLRWKGTLEELTKELVTYTWPENQEVPFLWLSIETPHPRYDLWDVCTQVLLSRKANERPIIINIDNTLGTSAMEETQSVDVSTTPHEIFEKLLLQKGIPITPQMRSLFDVVLSQVVEGEKQ
jgi:exonuclease SbcD